MTGLCCGFGTAGGGAVGASMTEERREKKRGGGDNAERMPSLVRRGLILLSRATDEPQMDGQLLWVCAFREVGVREEGAACFLEFGLKGPFGMKLSITVHVLFVSTVFHRSSNRRGFYSIQEDSQGALDSPQQKKSECPSATLLCRAHVPYQRRN